MKKSAFLRKLLSAVCCVAMLVTMLPIFPAAAEELLISPAPATQGSAISGGFLSSFSDANEITYTKAVEVTAGLGLFAGAGGKFMPKSNLTRAQMATVIVKMLYGADANANAFKGTGAFSDTAIYEGGWAEGYINWCATLGIVSGYGDGTFKPGANVTAAEAVTMILNALKVDAGEGSWPHTVMAKAEELDMFDDLLTKPASDKALTREELAVVSLVGLEYSSEDKLGYMYNGKVYDNYMDAYMVAGAANAGNIEVYNGDSLAGKVFEMKTFEGFVVANQATDPDLEYTVVANREGMERNISIQTGLEHIGHWVTAYYAEEYESDEEPGVAYTIYDETKVIKVEGEDLDTAKEYKAAFGKSYSLDKDGILLVSGQYEDLGLANAIDGYVAGDYAPEGTYFIHEGYIVAYMDPVPVYASKVTAVSKYEGNETVTLKGIAAPIPNADGDDRVVEYDGIAKDQYITYTKVGSGDSTIYALAKTEPATGVVTKISTNSDGDKVITLGGNQYVAFGSANNNTGLNLDDPTDFTATYTLYVTADGKYVGWEKAESAVDLESTVFILGTKAIVETDSYGKKVQITYARGVDMEGQEAMLPIRVQSGAENGSGEFEPDGNTDIYDTDCAMPAADAKAFYSIKVSNQKEPKKEGLFVLTAITSEYDETEQPIYSGVANTAAGAVFAVNQNVNGEMAYRKSTTLYITVDGQVDQSTPLTATIKTGTMTGVINDTGSSVPRYFLLSKSGMGVYMEVVVLCQEGISSAITGETVYISDAAVEDASRDANGYAYSVYNYKTGAVQQIILENPIDSSEKYDGSGFYRVIPETDEETVELSDKVAGTNFSGSASNSGTADGLYYENVIYDQVLASLGDSYFTTRHANGATAGITSGKGGTKGVFVDLRSEEEIVADGVGKIESMDRVVDLMSDFDQIIILMDMCYSTNSDSLLTVFVKDVYYSTAGTVIDMTLDGGKCYINGYDATGATVSGDIRIPDLATLYDLLNPEEAEEGYPPNEPANIEMNYTLESGKITEIEITKYLKAGVYFADDFSAYPVGDFDTDIATEMGYTHQTNTANGSIASEDGNKYFVADTGSRYYLAYNNADVFGAPFIAEFDIRRPDAAMTSTSTFRLGDVTVGGSTLNLRLYVGSGNNQIYLGYASGNSTKYYLQENSAVLATTNTDAMAIGVNEWWHIKAYVDPQNGVVTLSANERGGDTVYTGSTDFGGPISFLASSSLFFDLSTTAINVNLDNISISAVSDWEYPITLVQATGGTIFADMEGAATGTTVTLSNTADTGYAFSRYLVNGNPIEGNTFIMGSDPVTVTAEYEKGYNITLEQPASGSIAVEKTFVADGDEIVVTATLPTTGYWKLGTVTVIGADSQPVAAEITGKTKATFTMPAQAVTVSVTFADDTVPIEDDFSAYDTGAFTLAAANELGKPYTYWKGAYTAEITAEDVFKCTSGRVYLGAYSEDLGIDGITYKVEFDLMHEGNSADTVYRIGTGVNDVDNNGAGTLRFAVNKGDSTIYIYNSTNASDKYYLQKDNTLSVTADNKVVMPLDEWWHFELTVDTVNGKITLSAGKVGGTAYTGTFDAGQGIGHRGNAGAVFFDINTKNGADMKYLDNFRITKLP